LPDADGCFFKPPDGLASRRFFYPDEASGFAEKARKVQILGPAPATANLHSSR
jgi:hypothetical protein